MLLFLYIFTTFLLFYNIFKSRILRLQRYNFLLSNNKKKAEILKIPTSLTKI